jgi:hypothetical protein
VLSPALVGLRHGGHEQHRALRRFRQQLSSIACDASDVAAELRALLYPLLINRYLIRSIVRYSRIGRMKPTELIPLVLALLLGALLLGFMLAWLLNAITLPVG